MPNQTDERRPLRPTYFHQSAGAVVLLDNRCLAVKRADRDEWVFPKGHIEQDESPEEAAIREVREETGLRIRILGPIGSSRYSFGRDREHRKRVEWFLAEPIDRELKLEPIFGGAVFLDEEEAGSVLTHSRDREIAARAFEMAKMRN